MKDVLISWIGATDLRVMQEGAANGAGPVAQAVTEKEYSAIILVSDYPEEKIRPFLNWLQPQSPAEIILHKVALSSPTDFEDIYRAATKNIDFAIDKFGKEAKLTFHLSPGTPAMAAVWIILGKTKYPARLIESSLQYGVKTVSIPFDLAADFHPSHLVMQDSTLKRMAFGSFAEPAEFKDIICRSEIMHRVISRANQAAARSVPVLIEGESGTGKELLAQAIHRASPRSDEAFVVINCGAIPVELVESELFGHEKGAFTGADSIKTGHFEAADKGTLFLDEIGELPKVMQVKLLP